MADVLLPEPIAQAQQIVPKLIGFAIVVLSKVLANLVAAALGAAQAG